MSKRWLGVVTAAALAAGCASTEAPKAPPSQEEMMQAMMADGTPGAPHAALAADAGDWNVESTWWMDPAGPPMKSSAKATIRMGFAGRYQVQDYRGDFMGQPFEGMAITGYHNGSKEYFSTWIDSMSTGIAISRGNEDASGAKVMHGEFRGPGGEVMKSRFVIRHEGADKFVMEMYGNCNDPKTESKQAELVYTRASAAPKAAAPSSSGAPAAEAPSGAPSGDEQAAWMAYMTPSDAHKRMAADVGEWTAAGKVWMGPGAPPTEISGKSTIRMVLGGRFQMMDYSGDMMGMPFEGIAFTAYDNATKEITSTWADSMGTGLFVAKGKADAKGVVTLRGDMTDPSSGAQMPIREVTYNRDADTMVMEMYMTPPGGTDEFKMMELVYTRVKK